VVGGGWKVVATLQRSATGQLVEVAVTVVASGVREEAVELLAAGGEIKPVRATEYGTIVSVKTEPLDAYTLRFQKDILVPATTTLYRVELEFTGVGELFSNSYYLYGERVFINQDLILDAGRVMLTGTVTGVRAIE
jgi:hypothetical protein